MPNLKTEESKSAVGKPNNFLPAIIITGVSKKAVIVAPPSFAAASKFLNVVKPLASLEVSATIGFNFLSKYLFTASTSPNFPFVLNAFSYFGFFSNSLIKRVTPFYNLLQKTVSNLIHVKFH